MARSLNNMADLYERQNRFTEAEPLYRESLAIRRKAFGEIAQEDGDRLRAGTAVPDVKVARAAADASLDGLAFYRGIPGCIGGALRMNAGAHGGETTDVLVEARGVTPYLPLSEVQRRARAASDAASDAAKGGQ